MLSKKIEQTMKNAKNDDSQIRQMLYSNTPTCNTKAYMSLTILTPSQIIRIIII